MSEVFNIYCDESCHLAKDKQSVMLLGAMWCPLEKVKEISAELLELRKKANALGELKWTKVSPNKEKYYLSLIDYFIEKPDLHFRVLVVSNKDKLDHKSFNQDSHDTFYYKMYFSTISKILDPTKKYNIYLDIKDTRSNREVRNLKDILCNNFYDFTQEMIMNIQLQRSDESRILQLCDFFIGAVAYKNRELDPLKTKGKIASYLEGKLHRKLNQTTSLYESKFNIFIFTPQEGCHKQ